MSRKLISPLLQGLMMVLLASPLVLAYAGYYYVIPGSAPLRECAAPECDVLLTAYRGDKVEILERTSTGWSRVRLVDRTGIGWIPSDWLSFSPDLQAKQPPHSYVNISSLPLRQHPTPSASVLTMLHFNEQVEMLGVSASGWAQVRELRTSKVGWVPPRYLSSAPSSSPKSSRRRAPARKAPPKKEEPPEPPKAM